ncbi:DNA-directed RNA polymerase subunit beta [Zea mays]|uniref:DNA-directed RNA polymerase n=2 Tax=Zea mays TaxID=4577 RepID=A0A1D6KCI0_MAIZE|nr:DNA-directed RNA polymerase subunit beta [Zea mays]PWZ53993.1 DNA-directed RNA polymerase subunit beta [Zea mays]
MGSNLREILDNVSYPEILLSFPNAKKKKRIESKEKAILEFYQQLVRKIIHQVDEKIHGRSTRPYSLVTQQPIRGRAKQGGQRIGEMEVWALEGFGVAHILQEILTYKSRHLIARQEILNATIWGKRVPNHEDLPESFRVLVRELRSLALEMNHFLVSKKNFEVNREDVRSE